MTADAGRAAAEVLSMNDWTAVAVLTLALMAHLTLYLPLPLNDPEPLAAQSMQQQFKQLQTIQDSLHREQKSLAEFPDLDLTYYGLQSGEQPFLHVSATCATSICSSSEMAFPLQGPVDE